MPESPSAVAIFIDLAEDGWASMPDMAAALAPLVRMAAATVVRLPAGRLLRLSMSADGGLRAQPDHTGQPAVFAQEWINQAAMRGWHVLVLLGPTALDDAALTALGNPDPARVAVIGDSVEHDIAGAHAAGCDGWLLRDGIIAGWDNAAIARECARVGARPVGMLTALG